MARCASLTRPIDQVVYRCAAPRHATSDHLLSGEGSRKYGGRWNPIGIHAAYTSLDYQTAFSESIEAKAREGLPPWEALPLVIVAINVGLSRVLDLTEPVVGAILDPLGFTWARMADDDWCFWVESDDPTQGLTLEVGRLAHETLIQGLIVPSNPVIGGKNLVIFPDHCPPRSLSIINVDGLPK